MPAADPASVAVVSRMPEEKAAALAAATAKNLPAWQKRGRLNIVAARRRRRPGRSGLRTDTMMVATIDLKTHRAALFSVPRNMGGVPLPPRAARAAGARFPGILNALHGFGAAHPDLFPGGKDPGATALKQTLGQLTGLPIDYYVMVDFRGFHGLVDALGGVTLDIPHAVLDRVSPYEKGGEWIRIDLKPGRQHLSADQAFALRAGAVDDVGLGAHQAPAVRDRRAGGRDRADDRAAVVPRSSRRRSARTSAPTSRRSTCPRSRSSRPRST